ncbi:MAG: type II and III secretion system protein [Methylohalobius sp.]|nr:type II and III secretion system protein [Methylohalobius sp.]
MSVRHRLPQEVVKTLAPMLEKDERLVAVPDGVWVQANPARIEEISGLIAALDQRLRRLIVTVLQTDRFSLEELNAQASLEAGEAVHAQAKVYETRSEGSLGALQRLTTTEGQPAFIAVGQELPVPVINLFGPQAVGGIEYLPATTGFQVTPRLIGCRVRLTVAPWSKRLGRTGPELTGHAAETTLEAPIGRWIELGASGLDEDLAQTEPFAHRYETQARRLRLFVKIESPEGCEEER